MTAPPTHLASDYLEIADHKLAISISWVRISTTCGCVQTHIVWSATCNEDQRAVETEAARWSRVLGAGLGVDPLPILDRRRPLQ